MKENENKGNVLKEILELDKKRYEKEYKSINSFDDLIDYCVEIEKTNILQELMQNKNLCYLLVNYYASKNKIFK